jgi:hypothetical protein
MNLDDIAIWVGSTALGVATWAGRTVLGRLKETEEEISKLKVTVALIPLIDKKIDKVGERLEDLTDYLLRHQGPGK